MKITKKKIQQIIKEELEMAYSGPNPAANRYQKDLNIAQNDPKEQLLKIAVDALGLYCAIEEGVELEPWVENKISTVDNFVSKVKSHLETELQVEIPTVDVEKAIESVNKDEEKAVTDENYAGRGSFYYDV